MIVAMDLYHKDSVEVDTSMLSAKKEEF